MSERPINSGDWRKVRAYIDARIRLQQSRLERHDMTNEETALTRGRITELRTLIAWGEPESDGDEALLEMQNY